MINTESLTINGVPPIEPKEIEIRGKKFILSKIPAVPSRILLPRYQKIISGHGDGATGDAEILLKLMSYVFVLAGENWIRLSTEALVNSHVSDVGTLSMLELEQVNHNFFSSLPETISASLEELRATYK